MIEHRIKIRRVHQLGLTVLVAVMLGACSPAARQLFFDIPPAADPAEASADDQAAAANTQSQPDQKSFFAGVEGDGPRPEIESVASWDEAKKLLPKAGRRDVDWAEAVRQGLVKPRPGPDPDSALAAIFQYDFIIETEDPDNNVLFPHSAHTQWLGCKNCHATLYPKRRNPSTMAAMNDGESCGHCHGRAKVAFDLRACGRCHVNM